MGARTQTHTVTFTV